MRRKTTSGLSRSMASNTSCCFSRLRQLTAAFDDTLAITTTTTRKATVLEMNYSVDRFEYLL